MALFHTPTPFYKEQPANGSIQRPGGVYGWLVSLLRTPTPAYKPAPTTKANEPGRTADNSDA